MNAGFATGLDAKARFSRLSQNGISLTRAAALAGTGDLYIVRPSLRHPNDSKNAAGRFFCRLKEHFEKLVGDISFTGGIEMAAVV